MDSHSHSHSHSLAPELQFSDDPPQNPWHVHVFLSLTIPFLYLIGSHSIELACHHYCLWSVVGVVIVVVVVAVVAVVGVAVAEGDAVAVAVAVEFVVAVVDVVGVVHWYIPESFHCWILVVGC